MYPKKTLFTMSTLQLYNTLTRKKEVFEPLHAPHVGLYVCGPTVYGEPHLGHARPSITFDLLFRYLQHLGYKVRYVRNITDVGHLENDADAGEDKIAKKARLENLEPMEVAQHYTNRYHVKKYALNGHHAKLLLKRFCVVKHHIELGVPPPMLLTISPPTRGASFSSPRLARSTVSTA